MSKIMRLITDKEEATPKLIGYRGCSNNGIDFVFDKPIALNFGETGGCNWTVPWETLGKALRLISDPGFDEKK